MQERIWSKARKKPLLVQFREVRGAKDGDKEIVRTRGGPVIAIRGRDFIIKDIDDRLYPITKEIFVKTYDIIGEKAEPPTDGTACPPGFNPFTNCNEKCSKWRCW